MSPAGASTAADSKHTAMLVQREKPVATWEEVKGGRTGGGMLLVLLGFSRILAHKHDESQQTTACIQNALPVSLEFA